MIQINQLTGLRPVSNDIEDTIPHWVLFEKEDELLCLPIPQNRIVSVQVNDSNDSSLPQHGVRLARGSQTCANHLSAFIDACGEAMSAAQGSQIDHHPILP